MKADCSKVWEMKNNVYNFLKLEAVIFSKVEKAGTAKWYSAGLRAG
jgi:hypothetical protein